MQMETFFVVILKKTLHNIRVLHTMLKDILSRRVSIKKVDACVVQCKPNLANLITN